MIVVVLAISALLFGAMIGISWYGARVLGVSAVLIAGTAWAVSAHSGHGPGWAPLILLPFVLLALAVGRWGAISVARKRYHGPFR